jgi:hypothetical protein
MPANQRCGMELLRRLDDDERRVLEETYRGYQKVAPRVDGKIYWSNLYVNREFTFDHPLRDELHEWVLRTVRDSYKDWPTVELIAYGFVTNPRGNTREQPFHIDYTRTLSTLYVPVTPLSPRNALQYLPQPLRRAWEGHLKETFGPLEEEFGSLEDILDAERCDGIEVAQLVARPFSLLRLLPDTIHRGIGNAEEYDRVMFFASADDHYHALPESEYSGLTPALIPT